MDNIIPILCNDLIIAKESLADEEYEIIRIFGNRLTTNAYFGELKNYAILGFFLRELSSEYMSIKMNNEKRLDKGARDIGINYLENTINTLEKNPKDIDLKIWDLFFEYENKMRHYLNSEKEMQVYTIQPEFTNIVTNKLLKFLKNNIPLLLSEKYKILNGMKSEIGRTINNYGFSRRDLILNMILHVYSGYHTYLLYEHKIIDKNENESGIKTKLESDINQILVFLSENENPDDKSYDYLKLNNFIGEISFAWREYYIKFLDIYRPMNQPTLDFELPDETKKHITDTLSKAMEKEIRG